MLYRKARSRALFQPRASFFQNFWILKKSMQGIFAYIHRKCKKTFTYHEDFPDTIDGEKITQKVEVFSLKSFGILYSLLEIQKKGESRTKENHFHNHSQHKIVMEHQQ